MMNPIIATALNVANSSRASIGITEKHIAKMLGTLLNGADLAYVFGAKSMSSRAAFVLAVRDGASIRLVYADVRRQDANLGPAGAFPGFPGGPLGSDLPVSGESPEKHATARAAGRGIETHALRVDAVTLSRVLAWSRSLSPEMRAVLAA